MHKILKTGIHARLQFMIKIVSKRAKQIGRHSFSLREKLNLKFSSE